MAVQSTLAPEHSINMATIERLTSQLASESFKKQGTNQTTCPPPDREPCGKKEAKMAETQPHIINACDIVPPPSGFLLYMDNPNPLEDFDPFAITDTQPHLAKRKDILSITKKLRGERKSQPTFAPMATTLYLFPADNVDPVEVDTALVNPSTLTAIAGKLIPDANHVLNIDLTAFTTTVVETYARFLTTGEYTPPGDLSPAKVVQHHAEVYLFGDYYHFDKLCTAVTKAWLATPITGIVEEHIHAFHYIYTFIEQPHFRMRALFRLKARELIGALWGIRHLSPARNLVIFTGGYFGEDVKLGLLTIKLTPYLEMKDRPAAAKYLYPHQQVLDWCAGLGGQGEGVVFPSTEEEAWMAMAWVRCAEGLLNWKGLDHEVKCKTHGRDCLIVGNDRTPRKEWGHLKMEMLVAAKGATMEEKQSPTSKRKEKEVAPESLRPFKRSDVVSYEEGDPDLLRFGLPRRT
ncbi:MAG: hypothetical protein M1814_003200 [Vezdaea aestivalis]|nr:MAG: hypothetical protein M1814_003200 [Vezdaea aestivalis]